MQTLEQTLWQILGDMAVDAAHDHAHIGRVLHTARHLALEEGQVDADILTASAILHDLVNLPKDHPQRAYASRLSASKAVTILRTLDFDDAKLDGVHHAISAHSYSAQIPPATIEAKILQDADRLDALGAIGVARCFAISGMLGRMLMDPVDPLAHHRPLKEQLYALDHFQTKLLRLPDTMNTKSGQRLGHQRAAFVRQFMETMAAEQPH